ncbi:four helix bundle protein [Planctomicrobium sp. SH661]|uniref:four helix bundle protein n=1 Tax=Planctomicrobium sp. SH661 TaxID=3448124 RepID=UPI003F5B1503
MSGKFRFYELDVWRKGIDYAELIYQITSRFPQEEKFGLVSQLRRAAVSISSNIAEGSSRSSKADFARFIEIAYGSTMESVSQLCISVKLNFIGREEFDHATRLAEDVSRMLSGLRKNLQTSK